jgi:hypothetical protein
VIVCLVHVPSYPTGATRVPWRNEWQQNLFITGRAPCITPSHRKLAISICMEPNKNDALPYQVNRETEIPKNLWGAGRRPPSACILGPGPRSQEPVISDNVFLLNILVAGTDVNVVSLKCCFCLLGA